MDAEEEASRQSLTGGTYAQLLSLCRVGSYVCYSAIQRGRVLSYEGELFQRFTLSCQIKASICLHLLPLLRPRVACRANLSSK